MKSIPFTDPLFTFPEVIAATGADQAWLRTFIQRGKAQLFGTKHRTGRLFFSLKEIAGITILRSMNANLGIAPITAWAITNAIGPLIEGMETTACKALHIAFDKKGAVILWSVATGGHPAAWNDNAAASTRALHEANSTPHIVIPISAIVASIAKARKIARSWPDGGH